MRPLPLESLPSTLPFVSESPSSVAFPVPIVDAGALIGTHEPPQRRGSSHWWSRGAPSRWPSRVVVGVRELPAEALGDLPPLLATRARTSFSAIGVLDDAFLVVLRVTRLLPDSTWNALAAARGDT